MPFKFCHSNSAKAAVTAPGSGPRALLDSDGLGLMLSQPRRSRAAADGAATAAAALTAATVTV